MELKAKDIENVAFDIQEQGYSPKQVDEFLDKIIKDYKEIETKSDISNK